jgi:hypothetical protein
MGTYGRFLFYYYSRSIPKTVNKKALFPLSTPANTWAISVPKLASCLEMVIADSVLPPFGRGLTLFPQATFQFFPLLKIS